MSTVPTLLFLSIPTTHKITPSRRGSKHVPSATGHTDSRKMFLLFLSLAMQSLFLFSQNGNTALALSAIGFVLGRPVLSGLSVTWWWWIPGFLQNFIDLKVYGALAGLVAQMVMRFNRRSRVEISTIATVLLVCSFFILGGTAIFDTLYFWLLLAVPFSFGLALAVFTLPLVLVMNVMLVWRVCLSLVLFWLGVRDPLVDNGLLGRLAKAMLRVGGGALEDLFLGCRTLVEHSFFSPLAIFEVFTDIFFVPSFLQRARSRAFTSNRLAWSVMFFMFKLFDLEFMIYFFLGLFFSFLVFAIYTMSSLFGMDTIFDIMLPSLYLFQENATSYVTMGFSKGFQWFVANLVERSTADFHGRDALGKPLLVHDKDSFFRADRSTRRDIMVSYMQAAALPRVFFTGSIIVFLLLINLSFGTVRVFRNRIGALFSHVLSAFTFALIPFLVPETWLDMIDLGISTVIPLCGPAWEFIKTWAYGLVRIGHPVLGWVALSASMVPRLDKSKNDENQPNLSPVFFKATLALTRKSVLKLTERLNGVRLPEFTSDLYNPPTVDSVTRAYNMLVEAGFPVNQTFLDQLTAGAQEGVEDSYLQQHGSWRRWFLGRTSIGMGYPKVGVMIHPWVPDNWYEWMPGYKHVAGWNGEEPEVRATARYWTGNHLNRAKMDFDGLVDDMWHAVRVQYENSRLATFQEIYSGWTKRYNMGFGFVKEVNGKFKQLRRAETIQMMGGKWKFLEAWRKVFKEGLGMNMPAPVFAKYESLKAKKAMEKAVRTVVGSPFIHHVMTTVFNYHPNHNYRIWETPMKVGMPMNGQNFNRLWETMLRHEKVWAGDMTNFDSTQAPAVVRLCAAIRKKGYDTHKDRTKICELIDISYEALLHQPMGFKATGDMAFKEQGFTTGHSSTSSDNSLALVANYLFAWRRVTGLRAREFFNYNTLANFGDDHILAYDPVFGWNPQRMCEAMRELGTIMRDEAPGETRMPDGTRDFNTLAFSFLAKQPVPLTAAIKAELAGAGIDVPLTYATAHVKHRLIGKAKGEGLRGKLRDPVSSYEALLSYIHMCAHHPDVYKDLTREAHIMYQKYRAVWVRDGLIDRKNRSDVIKRPPTYNAVLRMWYSKEPFPFIEDDYDLGDDQNAFYVHLQDDILGLMIRWLADIPTLLSPRYSNTRWADWIQVKASWALNWPLTLVMLANKHEGNLRATRSDLAKTPYGFLRNESIVPSIGTPFGVLLTRHWLYMGLTRALGRQRRLSVLDLVRLADTSWASLVFILTGQVTNVAVELDLHILDTILILLISFVNVDSGFTACQYDLLSPSLVFARLLSTILMLLTPSGSIDYQPLDEQMRHLLLDPASSFILDAPTGVGKSTRMLNRLASALPPGWTLVAIQPRHIVAVEVGTYMKGLYPAASIGIQTEGHELVGGERLVYTTGQSFMASRLSTRKDVVVVLDEAHINEPIYVVLRNYLLAKKGLRKILVTATPTSEMTDSYPVVKVPAVSQFSVQRVEHEASSIKEYLSYVVSFCNDRLPFEKTLVFVPSIRMQYLVADQLASPYCVLNSKTKVIDPNASVYIATSVADAGLTIPDVNFVFSMDFDVQVTAPDIPFFNQLGGGGEVNGEIDAQTVKDHVINGNGSKPYHFDLPTTTIRQRAGRTGRTSDGYFHFFRVRSVERQEIHFTRSDFINGCMPASQACVPYFTYDLARTDPYLLNAIPFWASLPGSSYSTYIDLLNLYQSRIKNFGQRDDRLPPESPEGFRMFLAGNWESLRERVTTWPLALNPDEEVIVDLIDETPDPFEPEEEDVFEMARDTPYNPLEEAEDGDQVLAQNEQVPGEANYTRINVSGQRLLCGVRALRGAIWSYTAHRPDFDEVHAQVLNHIADDAWGGPQFNNFDCSPLREAAWFGYGLRIRVLFDDGTNPVEPSPAWGNVGPVAIIYQSPNHYNYHGRPIPSGEPFG